MKHTKIVATIGPASEKIDTLVAMIDAGLNVARLNFSHGDHAEHGRRAAAVRAAAKKARKTVALLQDLAGPKIRIGDFDTESVELIRGESFVLTTHDIRGNAKRVSVKYAPLPKYVKKGSRILLNDGKNELVVTKVAGTEIHTEVVVGGRIKGRRGVNVPGAHLPIKSLTAKDRTDVAFGASLAADFVAISFVRTARDVEDLRALLRKHRYRARIISKIETQEAMEHLEEIVAASDGVMVARGDLAVEIPASQVPLAQKRIIGLCREAGKPVIVATHMLESMMTSPTPTRAEVSDVANAVLDGTDAVMLSAESALGEFPVQAVQMMAGIATAVETSGLRRGFSVSPDSATTTDTVSDAVVHAAARSHAKAIIALTESGLTARMVSRFRPDMPIIAFTPHPHVERQLALSYGCSSVHFRTFHSIESVEAEARRYVRASGLAQKGDTIVIAAGIPFGTIGGTNLLLVQTL
jgi:pyruvate kinase